MSVRKYRKSRLSGLENYVTIKKICCTNTQGVVE